MHASSAIDAWRNAAPFMRGNSTTGVSAFIPYELQAWRVANFGSVIEIKAGAVILHTQDGAPPRSFKSMSAAVEAIATQ